MAPPQPLLPVPAGQPSAARPLQPRTTSGRPREQPYYSWTEWDSVTLVKSAIRQLEVGVFDQASLVVDAMGRDDRIRGVLSTRSGALPSLPMTMQPMDESALAKKVAEDATRLFERMVPDDQLSQLLEWGLMGGAGIGVLEWSLGDSWLPKLCVWHPRSLSWRWEEESFYVMTLDGQAKVTGGDGTWVCFTPFGQKRGWMRGHVRSLYVPWLLRQWGLRDWGRYSEVHGQPIRKAIVPADASKEDEAAYIAELALIGTESVVRSRQTQGASGDMVAEYDVQLVEAVGRSKEVFEGLVGMANTCVAVNLVGQNLTSEVKEGSFAAAVTLAAVRNDILSSDAELLGAFLREQLLRPWAAYNYGNPELAPTPVWKTKPPDDKKAKGDGFKALGDGLVALHAAGANPDTDKILEDDAVPVKAPAEAEPRAAAQPEAAAPGAVGGGSSAPGDRKLPRPQLRAAMDAAPSIPARELVEGQLYTDEASAVGTRAAARVLAPDLKALLELVQTADSYDSLRDALLKQYASMDRSALAALVEHALTLAELAGRHSVLMESTSEDDAPDTEGLVD